MTVLGLSNCHIRANFRPKYFLKNLTTCQVLTSEITWVFKGRIVSTDSELQSKKFPRRWNTGIRWIGIIFILLRILAADDKEFRIKGTSTALFLSLCFVQGQVKWRWQWMTFQEWVYWSHFYSIESQFRREILIFPSFNSNSEKLGIFVRKQTTPLLGNLVQSPDRKRGILEIALSFLPVHILKFRIYQYLVNRSSQEQFSLLRFTAKAHWNIAQK